MGYPWPMEHTFDLLRAAVPADLAPAESLARMKPSLGLLPQGSSSYFLECRLAKDDARIDFGACYRSPLDAAPLNAAAPPGAAAARPGSRAWDSSDAYAQEKDRGWGPVKETFSLWASRSSLLRSRVPFLWIEVDEPGLNSRPGAPGFLFCVDPGLARMPARFLPGPDSRAGLLAVADEIADLFFGSRLPQGSGRALWFCLTALPRDGRILHISAMPSRKPAALKLNIALPKHALLGFLRRIRWPGSPVYLESVWSAFHPFMSCAKIDLEISGGISPRIGLELHPFNASRDGRRAALARMEKGRIAQPRKSRALAAWSGTVTRVFPTHKWPTRMVKEFGMKLVLGEAGSVQAKGYLGFYPVFALR